MSLTFSDTTTKKGIIQLIEKELGFDYGVISGNSDLLSEFTAEINCALDDFFLIALPASGKWQLDDSNQSDYPIIQTNLVSGQRDYPFTTDGSGNLVLDIYAVYILTAASGGLFQQIQPVDVQSDGFQDSSFTTGQNITGIPFRYDKTANGIFLDPIPNYNAVDGLKVYINREASYFTSGDTAKKPGVPGLLHKYFVLKPAMNFAGRKTMANYKDLLAKVQTYEGDDGKIATYFSGRTRDERDIISGMPINFR